jgi:hypothetical protein
LNLEQVKKRRKRLKKCYYYFKYRAKSKLVQALVFEKYYNIIFQKRLFIYYLTFLRTASLITLLLVYSRVQPSLTVTNESKKVFAIK